MITCLTYICTCTCVLLVRLLECYATSSAYRGPRTTATRVCTSPLTRPIHIYTLYRLDPMAMAFIMCGLFAGFPVPTPHARAR